MLQEACVSAFSRDKYAKVKNSALGVLVKVSIILNFVIVSGHKILCC